ncbi:MAG: GTPase ObgE [Alphaproteobacteria bacterium]
MKFLDEAKIFISSGPGGNGTISFRREKNIEFGGPDGGKGGAGGHIIAKANPDLNTLIDFRYRQHFKAERGRPGEGGNRSGANAKDIILTLPVGTQILDEDKQNLLYDLTMPDQMITLAKGGDGGRGNASFKSAVNQAPRKAEPGWPGEEAYVWLRLKLLADIGLVGLPNAGKSTLLAALTRARPKIGNYPFTTLFPQLGVAWLEGKERVIADIPGLIEGAHEGRGLGTRFLGHIERCRALVHLIDGTGDDIVREYQIIRDELKAYGAGLSDKPFFLVINKADALADDLLDMQRQFLEEHTKMQILTISAVSGHNLDKLTHHLFSL